MEEVNSDGKANLDILRTVKYGKELLNEQLIPRRYHVAAKEEKEQSGKGSKISFCLNTTNIFFLISPLQVPANCLEMTCAFPFCESPMGTSCFEGILGLPTSRIYFCH